MDNEVCILLTSKYILTKLSERLGRWLRAQSTFCTHRSQRWHSVCNDSARWEVGAEQRQVQPWSPLPARLNDL